MQNVVVEVVIPKLINHTSHYPGVMTQKKEKKSRDGRFVGVSVDRLAECNLGLS